MVSPPGVNALVTASAVRRTSRKNRRRFVVGKVEKRRRVALRNHEQPSDLLAQGSDERQREIGIHYHRATVTACGGPASYVVAEWTPIMREPRQFKIGHCRIVYNQQGVIGL